MRLSTYIPAAVVIMCAGILALSVAIFATDRIEKSAYGHVARALLADGQGWVDVEVDGLHVLLSGEAPDEATRFRALKLAGSVVDGTRVRDRMEVNPGRPVAPPRFSIEILRNDAGISLIGLVPAAMDRAATAARVAELAGRAEFADLLERADYTKPDGWDAALDFSLESLAKLPRSKISVSADHVEIIASSDSLTEKRQLEADLARDAPAGIRLSLKISAPRPVITPFTLRFVVEAGVGRFDACSAHTDEGRDRIVAAAAASGVQGEPACVLGLGVPSPRWPDAAVAGIGALTELNAGSLTISDTEVSLVVPPDTDQSLFDRVVGELDAALPDVFSLTATKPEPVKIDGTGDAGVEGAPEFVATLSPEKLLQLRGRVTDERLRRAVEGFARARFSTAEVRPVMRLDPDLPDGWAARVFAGVEAMSLLQNGSLVVQPDFLDIRGVSAMENANSEISRILSAQLGEAANFAIEVTYRAPPEPEVEVAPDPGICVETINLVLAAEKVKFAPGSADIAAESLGTIDQLAEIVADCEDVPMEIAAHSDSQGRESMNLALSQRRAEAVLTALQARRVLTGALTPKGYGESRPIADNGTEEGREANRRIEFTLLAEEEELDEEDASDAEETEEPSEEAVGSDEQN